MSSADDAQPAIPTLLDDHALARLYDDFASTDDLGELARLVRNFFGRGDEHVAAVAEAAAAGDVELVRRTAHKLKGSSRTLGATLAGAVAERAEQAGAEGDAPAARRAVAELEIVWSLTRAALSDVVDAIGEAVAEPRPQSPLTARTRRGAVAALRALLADDEPIALAVLRATVERLGHDTTVVRDGDSALAAYDRIRPDIVITDLHMPGIDGLELARRIRARGDRTYVAVLSASGAPEAAPVGESIDAFLTKPVREDELEAVLGLAAARATAG